MGRWMLCRFENGKRGARSRIPGLSRRDLAEGTGPGGSVPCRVAALVAARAVALVRPDVRGRTVWEPGGIGPGLCCRSVEVGRWGLFLSQWVGWVWGCGNGVWMALLAVTWIMRVRLMVMIVEMMLVVVDMSVDTVFSSILGFRSSVVSVCEFFRSIIVDGVYPEFMWSVV